MESLRQRTYPSEWRIDPPSTSAVMDASHAPDQKMQQEKEHSPDRLPRVFAEIASCFWYLKTKHFKRDWKNDDTMDEDPRVRRTLGRLNKGVDALKKCGVEVEDPTSFRYVSGSEAMMKPLDFVKTEGLTYDKVVETVTPLVYWDGRIVQRAEVFVAVPISEVPSIPSDVASSSETAQEMIPPATDSSASIPIVEPVSPLDQPMVENPSKV
jgi:hypothetical protein